MYDGRRATSWVSVFYFVSLIIMGMMIVMNLFLAILLSNFTNKEDVDKEAALAEAEAGTLGPSGCPPGGGGSTPITNGCRPPNHGAAPGSPGSPKHPSSLTRWGTGSSIRESKPSHQGGHGHANSQCGSKVVPTVSDEGFGGQDYEGGGKRPVEGRRREAGGAGEPGDAGEAGEGVVSSGACPFMAGAAHKAACGIFKSWIEGVKSLRVPDDLDPGRAMWIMGPRNPIRRACAAVVANPGFDRMILLLISVSSIALAIDNPLRNPDSALAVALKRVEVIMTGLFFVEMALKICAHGFIAMPGAYLRNSWNVLDFVVVVISLFQLFSHDSSKLKSLRSLRALRALRPLRFVSSQGG